jgi:hypothetical protein
MEKLKTEVMAICLCVGMEAGSNGGIVRLENNSQEIVTM